MKKSFVPFARTFLYRGSATVCVALALLLGLPRMPAWSEPSSFTPLQSAIFGASDADQELKAIWAGTLRPKMQTLNARFNTALGVFLLSIKKDRCANTGNVPNLFACPARLAVTAAGKSTVIQTYDQFYFSGELPSSDAAPSYVEQTGRNHTRVAIDAEQGVLLVEDTNNGNTGKQSLPIAKP